MSHALIYGMSPVVVVLDDLPVVSPTEAGIGGAYPTAVVGDGALRDFQLASNGRLGHANAQHLKYVPV
jgi:hypothetical protein